MKRTTPENKEFLTSVSSHTGQCNPSQGQRPDQLVGASIESGYGDSRHVFLVPVVHAVQHTQCQHESGNPAEEGQLLPKEEKLMG